MCTHCEPPVFRQGPQPTIHPYPSIHPPRWPWPVASQPPHVHPLVDPCASYDERPRVLHRGVIDWLGIKIAGVFHRAGLVYTPKKKNHEQKSFGGWNLLCIKHILFKKKRMFFSFNFFSRLPLPTSPQPVFSNHRSTFFQRHGSHSQSFAMPPRNPPNQVGMICVTVFITKKRSYKQKRCFFSRNKSAQILM